MGNLQIDILGTSFALQANEEDEYLNKIYEYYKSIVRQVDSDPKLKDPLKKAIISGIMICDELCKSKQKLEYTNQTINRQDLDEAEKITLRMIENLNKVSK
ncbi:MAG: cell division protein ZapA [Spirochaetaceae bacterium]|nr:cell division protein ZapA [Spirochaetaceae bacterium]MBQ3024433.1 cell division protein ZapA [Spirochaetaceae bacterium]MBQ7906147.1 cell division protein ZapA [Spirochaetaceae bacterium]